MAVPDLTKVISILSQTGLQRTNNALYQTIKTLIDNLGDVHTSLTTQIAAVATGGGTTGSGITQLTGDVTAGPGSGSQAATLATVNSNVGSFGNSTHVGAFTVNAKGLITAASNVAISSSGGGSNSFAFFVA